MNEQKAFILQSNPRIGRLDMVKMIFGLPGSR